jgi:hypothetical protein
MSNAAATPARTWPAPATERPGMSASAPLSVCLAESFDFDDRRHATDRSCLIVGASVSGGTSAIGDHPDVDVRTVRAIPQRGAQTGSD